VVVNGADPLNLVGILTPGDLVTGLATNRILYRDGIPVAVRAGEERGAQFLVEAAGEEAQTLRTALMRGRVAPLVRTYLGKTPAGRV
jgi:ATP-dependent Lhr-like helicase